MFQKKILTSLFLILTFIGGFFANITINTGVSVGINGLYAATTDPKEQKSDETDCKGVNCAAKALNSIFQVVTIVAMPAIVLASWLMSPDWTSGDAFNLRDTMYQLWVTVSNVIYFIYAVLLIIIAIGTILGNEKFGYKAMLPRLALGIIMVPFTWWFVQWTISLATVVTASVVSIPADLQITGGDNDFISGYRVPSEWKITSDTKDYDKLIKENLENCSSASGGKCINLKEFYEKAGGIYGSLLIYAYGVFQIHQIQDVSGTLDNIKSVGSLVNELVIGVLFFVVFGLLVIALVFVLLMRAIKLWMYAIFSPLFTIHFVLGKDTLGEKMGDFNLKEFIGLCFVPAVIGITLSFGLVVIGAIKGVGISSDNTNCSDTDCTINIMGSKENTINTKKITDKDTEKTVTTIKIGGISLVFEGKAYQSGTDKSNTTGSIKKGLNVLGPFLGTIIVDIIALIFIWVAFMAAKSTSKAVAKAIDPFEKLGKSIGELGASLPKYAPLPIPGGSLSGANKLVGMGQNALEYGSQKRMENDKLYKYLKDKSGDTTDAASRSNVREAVNNKDLGRLIESLKGQDGSNSVRYIDDILKDKTNALATIKDQRYNIESSLRKRAEDLINQPSMTESEKYELMAILRGAKNTDSIKTQPGAKQFMDEQARKEKAGINTANGATPSTVINIDAGTSSEGAIKEIQSKMNNGVITEANLKIKLEEIYDKSPKKDEIIKAILDGLKTKDSNFTFANK